MTKLLTVLDAATNDAAINCAAQAAAVRDAIAELAAIPQTINNVPQAVLYAHGRLTESLSAVVFALADLSRQLTDMASNPVLTKE